MDLNEYKRLSGIAGSIATKDWQLDEATSFVVGSKIEVTELSGIDSGKKGVIVSFDQNNRNWAQVRTTEDELLWMPTSHLMPLEWQEKDREALETKTVSESTKPEMIASELKSYANTFKNIADEMISKAAKPLGFYTATADLIADIAAMLIRVTGDKDEAMKLRDVAEKLALIGHATRHTDSWEAMPTAKK